MTIVLILNIFLPFILKDFWKNFLQIDNLF